MGDPTECQTFWGCRALAADRVVDRVPFAYAGTVGPMASGASPRTSGVGALAPVLGLALHWHGADDDALATTREGG